MDDHLSHLNRTADWISRRTGALEMQQAVLRWAVAHRAQIQAIGLDSSLIAAMEQQVGVIMADRPKLEVA